MKLEDLRLEIDRIDSEIIELLAERMTVVKRVGELKKQNNAIIYRPEREQYILDRLEKKAAKTLLKRETIDAIFMEIFAASRNFELPERVAYLGPEGSFTHQAAESRFGMMSDYIPLENILAVFESVTTKRSRFGVVPIENNREGFVRETIDLLYQIEVNIVAEIFLPIHLTFAGLTDRLNSIKRIYSREIAFGQSHKFLSQYFTETSVELVPVESTSKAAKLASQDKESAAICSNIAAKTYKIPILFENIEDSPNNRTRFIIISKDFDNQPSQKDKTTLIVILPDIAGALAEFLQDFNSYGINLNKIESRPIKEGDKFKSWFYIEFDGHKTDENVRHVLEKNKQHIRVLGSYVKLV